MCTGAEAAPAAEAVKAPAEVASAADLGFAAPTALDTLGGLGAGEIGIGGIGTSAAGLDSLGALGAGTLGAGVAGIGDAGLLTAAPYVGAGAGIGASDFGGAAAALGGGAGASGAVDSLGSLGAGSVGVGDAAPAVSAATPSFGVPAAGGLPVGGGATGLPGVGADLVNPDWPSWLPAPQASTAAAAAPEAAGAGIQDTAMKALKTLGLYDDAKGTIGQNALPAAALVGSQVAASRNGKSLQSQLQQAGARTGTAADTLIGQGLSGTPNQGQAYQIDQWLQGQVNQINQRYANMGRDPNNDSAAKKELADAQAQAIAMRDQAAQGALTQGLGAAGLAQGPATQAAIAGAQQDKDLQQAMAGTLQNMALLEAIQNRQ